MADRTQTSKRDGRRATSSDVARAAGVSRSTVSLVLNNVQGMTFHPDTVRKVREAAEQLGYVPNVPARSVMTRKGYAFGVVSFWVPGSTLFARTFQGMLRASRRAGYALTVCDIAGSSADVDIDATVGFYKQGRIDGVAALVSTFPGSPGAADFLARLKREKIPFVFINSYTGDRTVDEIRTDNFSAGYLGTRRLLDLGHTRIGYALHRAGEQPLRLAEVERLRGYKAALEEAGIPVDESLIMHSPLLPAKVSVETGHAAFSHLLESGRVLPTAIYAINDLIALGVMYRAAEHGMRVPEDLAVVGTDDLDIASQVRPALTSVRQPLHELGEEAIKLLLRRTAGSEFEKPVQLNLPCTLKIRASCGGDESRGVKETS